DGSVLCVRDEIRNSGLDADNAAVIPGRRLRALSSVGFADLLLADVGLRGLGLHVVSGKGCGSEKGPPLVRGEGATRSRAGTNAGTADSAVEPCITHRYCVVRRHVKKNCLDCIHCSGKSLAARREATQGRGVVCSERWRFRSVGYVAGRMQTVRSAPVPPR